MEAATRGPRLGRERIPAIQGLRALAAASVLIYHVWRFGAPDGAHAELGMLSAALPHLWHGVTLFFVLSGFLLYRPFAAALLRGTPRPEIARYLRSRALRIFPAYWVVLLITAFVLRTAQVPESSGPRTEGVPGADLLLVNLLLLQNYSPDTIFTGVGPAWSLAVELAFYAVLPVLALLAFALAARSARRRTAVLAPVALLLLAGISGKLAALTTVDWHLGVGRSLWGLADMFALGMLVAVVSVGVDDRRLVLPRRWRTGTLALVAAIAGLAWAAGDTNLEPRAIATHATNLGAAVTCALLLALVVMPGERPPGRLLRGLEGRALAAAGLVSYSVFLWHEPVLHWLRVHGMTAGGTAGFALNLAVVAVFTGVLATLTYRFVEAPALRLKDHGRLSGRRAPRPGGAGVPPGRALLTRLAGLLALGLIVMLLSACGDGADGQRHAEAAPAQRTSAPGSVPEPLLGRVPEPEPEPEPFSRLDGVTTATALNGTLGDEGLARWERRVPRIEDVRIPSSAGDRRQPALWLPPSGEGDQPLIVVLHSWSNRYKQHIGIPFAEWADERGWAMIAPNFRGVNNKPSATGSDLAVQDVLDAVDFAIAEGGVDDDRVFTVGFSGGGMMSLLLAGRHPERVAGAVSWVPVYDLGDWYRYNATQVPRRDYADHIVRSCGGDAHGDVSARRRCRQRSPSGHLDAARRAGVPVYIGHGLQDTLVRPDHAARAFNQLAEPGDRIGERSIDRIASNRLPEHLREAETKTYFGASDPDVLFSRRSGSTTLVLFEGRHDMVYHPGLEWMTRMSARAR